ncbi:hypothetical protein CDAR_32411 [Caerostris darwini]|uniref:Uncharacterized protein n=1 Tax=Caerostris darwini TaxID=1538125 RepID=A0AAV4WL18_9ARAC|nr:hypothetical protein CDAR_32411 [Caerostris darwini]
MERTRKKVECKRCDPALLVLKKLLEQHNRIKTQAIPCVKKRLVLFNCQILKYWQFQTGHLEAAALVVVIFLLLPTAEIVALLWTDKSVR